MRVAVAGTDAIERILVVLSALVWIPLLGATAAISLLAGGQPVLILHRRVGFKGNDLWVPKIATMARTAAVATQAAGFIARVDSPPLAFGAALRTPRSLFYKIRWLGLDELPQLALVVSGRMRLVGPRPVTAGEVPAMYGADVAVPIDTMKPGLLGLWQVSARETATLAERRAMDEEMLATWSFGLWMRILFHACIRIVPQRSRRNSAC